MSLIFISIVYFFCKLIAAGDKRMYFCTVYRINWIIHFRQNMFQRHLVDTQSVGCFGDLENSWESTIIGICQRKYFIFFILRLMYYRRNFFFSVWNFLFVFDFRLLAAATAIVVIIIEQTMNRKTNNNHKKKNLCWISFIFGSIFAVD